MARKSRMKFANTASQNRPQEFAVDEGEAEEEACALKPLRSPRDPTAAERARRDNPPGRRVHQDEIAVPEILMDYCFVRSDDDTDTVTILLMKDRYSRAIQAFVVDRKGPDLDAADVAQRVLMGLRSFEHRRRVLIKTDNEPAILSLKEEMMRRLEFGVIPVEHHPPPFSSSHESESNGFVEKWGKIV